MATFKERIEGLPCPNTFKPRQCKRLISKLKKCAGRAGKIDV